MTKKTAALPSLKAMAEGKVEGVAKMTNFTVDPDLVQFEEGFNLREEGPDLDAHLERLYQAMKSGAYVPPIDVSVVDGKVLARDGHCRTRVARRLKGEGIPYLLQARQFRGNEADCVLHMLGSAQGKALTPLEAGRGFLRLVRYNMTVADICRRTGLNRTTVDNGVTLAESPVPIQRMISDGMVSVQVALDAIKKHGDKATEHLQAIVDKASQAGVTKVTKKHVSGPRVPAKAVQSFVSATTALRAYLDETPKERTAMEDGLTVMVPGQMLRELLDAHAQIGKPAKKAAEEEL